MRLLVGSLALMTFTVGCVVEELDTAEVVSEARCSTCTGNGLPDWAWKAAPGEFSPPAFSAAGLRIGASGVRPLCAFGSVVAAPMGGKKCDLDPQWKAWATSTSVPLSVREIRDTLLRYIVKVAARQQDSVVFASWATVPGGFGLAPSALELAWDNQTQSLITAGMAVAVDAAANGVEICMKTKFTPDCPASYAYHELSAVGNLFAGQPELVIGGYDAERPEDSRRVCLPWGPTYTTCNTYSSTAAYHDMRCIYTGPWTQRHPEACTPAGGTIAMTYAVQVFTEFDPALPGSSGSSGPRL